MNWTQERIETCRRLYIEGGLSAAETARLVGGVSRSAVLGLAHRRAWPRKAEVGDLNREIGKWIRKAAARDARPQDPSRADRPDGTDSADAPHARPWLSRRRNECAFPIGEPETPMRQRSCCAPIPRGERYCARHKQLMRLPPPCSAKELEQALERYFT